MVHVDHGYGVAVLIAVKEEADFVKVELYVHLWSFSVRAVIDCDLRYH